MENPRKVDRPSPDSNPRIEATAYATGFGTEMVANFTSPKPQKHL